jgi:hypothetical protein
LENGNLEDGKAEIRRALKVDIREVDCEHERQIELAEVLTQCGRGGH